MFKIYCTLKNIFSCTFSIWSGDLVIKATKMKIVGLNLFPPNALNAPCSYSMDHPKTISFTSGPKAGPRN